MGQVGLNALALLSIVELQVQEMDNDEIVDITARTRKRLIIILL